VLVRFRGRCERIRKNNGITEILLTRRAQYGDEWSHEQHALFNLTLGLDEHLNEGDEYWVEVRPASTHRVIKSTG
jgi:hypothetical protein